LSSHKTSGEKKRYIKRLNQNSGAPTWVVVKTNRKVSRNPKQRNWRSRKLNL
jgi:large subunit ribosomal protein L39e